MAAQAPTDNRERGDDPGSGSRSKRFLLGLPCSQCMAYYEAERTACPICGCTVRLSPLQDGLTISEEGTQMLRGADLSSLGR